jgi:hypothetical protein
MDPVKKASEKYIDAWEKYSLTSRISIGLFVLTYVMSTIAIMNITMPVAIAKVILDTTSMVAMMSVIMVIVGNNTFVKIVEIIYNKKQKESENSNIEPEFQSSAKPING